MRIPIVLLLTLGAGCGGGISDSFPATSAASLDAPEAQPRSVTRALDTDPPPPGDSLDGWPGLSADEAPSEEGHHHHGHGAEP